MPWRVVFDHRSSLRPHVQGTPPNDTNFATVYTPDTTQNNPNSPGNYHFWLTRHFNTNAYPDGNYRFEVEASDVRGNVREAALNMTFANAD